MARLAAVEKSLFYPTPLSVIPLILKHIDISGTYGGEIPRGTIFDPCAGTGEPVALLAKLLGGWRTYGVELDGERCETAKQHMDGCVHAAIEQVGAIGELADIVFVNPPYDQVGGRRVEPRFVRLASKYLRNGGLMIIIVPESLVEDGDYSTQMEDALRESSIDSAKVFRFPEPEYELFKQVVIIGTRNGRGYYPSLDLKVKCVLGDVPPKKTDRYDPVRDSRTVALSQWRAGHEMSIVRQFDGDLEESEFSDGNFDILHYIVGEPGAEQQEMRPLMPMKDTHAAMIAASGMLNGVRIGNKVVRGTTAKRLITTERLEKSADGSKEVKVLVEAEVLVVHLSMLDLETGEIETVNSLDNEQAFETLLLENAESFVEAAHKLFPPICDESTLEKWRDKIEQVRAPRVLKGKENGLFEPQKERIAAVLEGWQHYKAMTLVGEMSVGKTVMSLAAAAVAAQRRRPGNRNIIIVLPPRDDLVDKWAEEAARALRDFENPDGSKGPKVFRVNTIKDVREAFDCQGLTVILMKETSAKLSSGWGEVIGRLPVHTVAEPRYTLADYEDPDNLKLDFPAVVAKRDGKSVVFATLSARRCPDCGEYLSKLEGDRPACPKCHAPLWQTTRRSNNGSKGYAKYPLAKYIRDRYHTRYILIVDEAHKMKGGDTAVGYAYMDLVSSAWRVLQMTGTIFGGLASSIFYLMYRTIPEFRSLYSLKDVQRYINAYGLYEKVTKFVPQYRGTTFSGYREYGGSPSEKPGVAPGMAALLLPTSAFITLEDLAFKMPKYAEHTLFVDLDRRLGPFANWLQRAAGYASGEARNGNHSPLGQYRQARLGTWDIPTMPDSIGHESRESLDTGLGQYFLKEEAFLRLVWKEKQAGRKVITFVAQINARDCTPRLTSLLEHYGMKGVVLRATEKSRVPFIRRALAGGADVVFSSPDILDVGIDLEMFQTAIWYGVHYSMYVVPQANRRLLRLSQTGDVDIYYLAYNETHQAAAFHHVARKMAAQQAIQGDIRHGLAGVLGEDDFVSKLQDMVATAERVDSELTIDDLPPMPAHATKQAPAIKLAPVTFGTVKVAGSAVQATFF